jgi:signal transduction histidine kinase
LPQANFLPRLPSVTAWIVILAGALLAAFWIGLLTELDRARMHYFANAERSVTSLSRAFAEQTRRTLRSAEGVLRQIQRDIDVGRDPGLNTIFERNPDLVGIAGSVAVADADGIVVLEAGGVPTGSTLDDRPWFAELRDAEPGALRLGRPNFEASTRLWRVPLVLRRDDASGRFAGVIYISLLSDYFDNFYAWGDTGPKGAIAIYGLDGTVYARRAAGVSEIGKVYVDHELIDRALTRPIGNYNMHRDVDGVARVTAYRLVGEYPLVVSVGFAEEDVLAPYRVRQRLMLAEGAALTLVGLLLAGFAAYVLSRERFARAGIARTEQRLRDAIESIDSGFCLFDPTDRLVLCNDQYRELLPPRQDGADIIGLRFEQIIREAARVRWFSDPAKTRKLDEWVAERVSQHRNPPRDAIEMQITDGRWFQVSERRTADGYTVGVYTDLTRRRQQEEALRSSEERLQRFVTDLELSRQQLEQQASDLARLAEENEVAKQRAEAANMSKSQFLANMSHELRTPLNAIIGFSDLMKGQLIGPIGSPRYLEYARDIHSSGTHLLSLINDVLDMSKIEAGRYTIHPEPLDAAEMLRNCARLVRVRASEAGVALGIGVSQELPLKADARALKQILLNLLTNAIKFTPSGGSVNLSAGRETDGVIFRVADTGCGIPAEDLPRIGRRFEQVDNALTRKGEGTGLGLALCRALVELHGGTLTIESTVGVGTTVSVWIPLNLKTEQAA